MHSPNLLSNLGKGLFQLDNVHVQVVDGALKFHVCFEFSVQLSLVHLIKLVSEIPTGEHFKREYRSQLGVEVVLIPFLVCERFQLQVKLLAVIGLALCVVNFIQKIPVDLLNLVKVQIADFGS